MVVQWPGDMPLDDARRELEFLVTRCFISGFGTQLSRFNEYLPLFFNPPTAETARWFREQAGTEIPTASGEYRTLAEGIFYTMRDAYQKLPWDRLLAFPQGPPIKPHYEPLANNRIYLLDPDHMEHMLSETLFDPRIVPQEYEKLKEATNTVSQNKDMFGKTVVELKRRIKAETGEEPIYEASIDIHPRHYRDRGV
jgi:hypothetical protein